VHYTAHATILYCNVLNYALFVSATLRYLVLSITAMNCIQYGNVLCCIVHRSVANRCSPFLSSSLLSCPPLPSCPVLLYPPVLSSSSLLSCPPLPSCPVLLYPPVLSSSSLLSCPPLPSCPVLLCPTIIYFISSPYLFSSLLFSSLLYPSSLLHLSPLPSSFSLLLSSLTVPFMMPLILVILSARKSECREWMIGMPPHTAASKLKLGGE
jgi:hypothetical protein